MTIMSWTNCPICGESDMQCDLDDEGRKNITCTNHNCASNGGTNKSALPTTTPKVVFNFVVVVERELRNGQTDLRSHMSEARSGSEAVAEAVRRFCTNEVKSFQRIQWEYIDR